MDDISVRLDTVSSETVIKTRFQIMELVASKNSELNIEHWIMTAEKIESYVFGTTEKPENAPETDGKPTVKRRKRRTKEQMKASK